MRESSSVWRGTLVMAMVRLAVRWRGWLWRTEHGEQQEQRRHRTLGGGLRRGGLWRAGDVR